MLYLQNMSIRDLINAVRFSQYTYPINNGYGKIPGLSARKHSLDVALPTLQSSISFLAIK